jgi:hypothetical protein
MIDPYDPVWSVNILLLLMILGVVLVVGLILKMANEE